MFNEYNFYKDQYFVLHFVRIILIKQPVDFSFYENLFD